MKRVKNKVILFFIIFIALALRFWQLGNVPHSINGDQLHYLLNAKPFIYTGLDATQTKSLIDIFSFRYPASGAVQAELPFLISLLSAGFLPYSLFNSFYIYALFGILIVLLIYLITKELVNEQAGLFAGFIAATNPWLVFISRTSYEMVPATLFWLGFVYSLLIFKKWYILISFGFFVLAFYSYIGTKLIAIPISIILLGYIYFIKNRKKYFRQYLSLGILISIFVGFYIYQLMSAPGSSRISEILNPADSIFAQTVDAIRKTTIQNPVLSTFENKVVIFMMVIFSNFFNIISPAYLFLNGDYFMSLGQFGIFNPLDFVFLIIGTIALFKFDKKLMVLFYLLIIVSFIPQIVHKNSNPFTPHIMLAIPFFIMVFSASILLIKNNIKNIWLFLLICVFGFLYIFITGRFLHIYFYRMPLQNDFFNLPNRIAARYIELSDDNRKVIIFSNNSADLYREYIFYNDLYTGKNITAIANNLNNKNYVINNVHFRSCDSLFKNKKKDVVLIKNQCNMNLDASSLSISNLSDGGWVYRIFNDDVCGNYELNRYPHDIKLNDFAIENMSTGEFCKKFIVDPNQK